MDVQMKPLQQDVAFLGFVPFYSCPAARASSSSRFGFHFEDKKRLRYENCQRLSELNRLVPHFFCPAAAPSSLWK